MRRRVVAGCDDGDLVIETLPGDGDGDACDRRPSRSSARIAGAVRGRRRRPVGRVKGGNDGVVSAWSLDQTTKETKGPNDRTPTDRPELRASLRHHSFAVTR